VKARLRPALLGLATIALLWLSAGVASAAEQAEAQRLAETYAPIMMLRDQKHPPCDTSEEQYRPTTVDSVLGNPLVTLTKVVPGKGAIVVGRAATSPEIAGLGSEYHLNLPGDPLGNTCVYARAFRALERAGKAPPVIYAHISRQARHSGFALQYWFFWYFNQFNDVHEGDWEGMQLAFRSSSVSQARSEGPSTMILFQHAGGERARWRDSKVQKEGTHPIVYSAAGSHATFYDSAIYVENGQAGSGLGCDNTTAPLRELRPQTVLLPSAIPAHGLFSWLSFDGHWGQQEKGFNNGPTGPTTKKQWREPFTWMEGQRSTSPRLPGGSVLGPDVTNAFCGAVASASELVNLEAKSRPAALATLIGLVALISLFVGLTRWGPVELTQLRARRSFGQLIRAARQLYGRHWPTMIAIGLTAIPIVGGVNLLANQLAAGHQGVELALADLLETLGRPIASAVVAAVVVVLVRSLVEAHPSGFRASYRGMAERFWRVVAVQLLATFGVILLAITIIGLPWAVKKYVSWSFVQQEVIFTDKSIREAFRDSSHLVHGRWWHTVRVDAFLWLLSTVVGPVLGFALIFTNFSLLWINILGSLIFALIIPYVAVGHTLLYFDLQERERAPAKRRRSWRLRGARAEAIQP
jgi:hypothetical protein